GGARAGAAGSFRGGGEREGRHVRGDRRRRTGAVGRIVRRIRARLPIVQRDGARRAQERLARLTAGAGVDPARLTQELAAFADRGDVTEELVRLRGQLAAPATALPPTPPPPHPL